MGTYFNTLVDVSRYVVERISIRQWTYFNTLVDVYF